MSGEKLTQEIKAQITELIISKLESKYHLCYADRDCNLDGHAKDIQKAIDNANSLFLFDETEDWFWEERYNSAREIIKQIANELTDDDEYKNLHECIDIYFDTQGYDDVVDEIYMRDVSDPLKDIVDNTTIRARVSKMSNYESLPSYWDMAGIYSYSDYFKEMLDLLCLNPAKVKKIFMEGGIDCVGRFPNKPERNGKEAVKYEALRDEIRNQTSYCELTFMGMLPLQSLLDNEFKLPDFIVIPKGNMCGMFSSWAGGGSMMEMQLLRDIKVSTINKRDKYNNCKLMVDEKGCNHGYSINEVYGYGGYDAWGEEFELIYKNTKTK